MNKEDYRKEVFNWLEIAGKKPGKEMLELAENLIEEEYKEFHDALAINDKIQIMDALVDITWVLYNKLFANRKNSYTYNNKAHNHIEQEIPKILEKLQISSETFNIYEKAVRDSNYSKFCNTEDEHDITRISYESGTHPDKIDKFIYCEPAVKVNDCYPVIQKETGKILKSINYKPAEELFKLYSNNKTFQ
jgi:hypothetical protein